MKARLCVGQMVYRPSWYWVLEPKSMSGTPVEIGSVTTYSSKRGAERSAKRWAKKHNIEIVKYEA
jgi:hypothetical protein